MKLIYDSDRGMTNFVEICQRIQQIYKQFM